MIGQRSLLFCGLVLFAIVCSAQKPELVVQTGHSAGVNTVAFSPDGKTLASGSHDSSVKLWEVATGIELRTFLGHYYSVNAVVFSPGGEILASASTDDTVKLWDVLTGAELHTLKGHSRPVKAVTFSPDGRTLISGSEDNMIKMWDASTGAELRTLKGHSNTVTSVAFSPDGKTLASASYDKAIKLWDVATGHEVRNLAGHFSGVTSIVFSPDGKTLASNSGEERVKLWNVATGAELRPLDVYADNARSVTFSADWKTFANTDRDQSIQLWDLAAGAKSHRLKEHSERIIAITFSSNGKVLASIGDAIKLWDVSTGAELRTIVGHGNVVTSVAFSPDGKTLVSNSVDRTVKLWDISEGADLRILKGHSWSVTSAAFSPDGKSVASGSSDTTVKLWDVSKGAELRTLRGHSENAQSFVRPDGVISVVASSGDGVTSVAFSPDGKTLAYGSEDKSVKLWEVATGVELRPLKGHSGHVTAIAFSPDGKSLASASRDNTLILWDLSSGTALRSFRGHSGFVWSVAFSPDGRLLASGSWDRTVKLWNVATGADVLTMKHSWIVTSVTFSPDGLTLASASWDQTVKLWDVATGSVLLTLRGHSSSVQSVVFSPNGEYLVSSSADKSFKVWQRSSGKELASLIAIDEHDWIIATPDGLFDGSPAAWKQLMWRFDNNTFSHAPVEAFFKEFYRPGLLQQVMSGKTPEPPKTNLASIDIRQPNIKITAVDSRKIEAGSFGLPVKLAGPLTKREVEIAVEVTDNNNKSRRPEHATSSGAQDLRLFRGGSLVKHWKGDVFAKGSGCEVISTKSNEPQRALCRTLVTITAGDNELTAYIFNTQNVKSTDFAAMIEGADALKRKGKLHILGVGVNDYANQDRNLRYAVADAVDFATELRKRQIDLRNYDTPDVIRLTDTQATKNNILQVLEHFAHGEKARKLNDASDNLASVFAAIEKVQPEDVVVIYFAGHGTAANDRFYLIPHDGFPTVAVSAIERVAYVHRQSISDLELEAALRDVDANQMIMVIDACNSGQALEAEEKRRGPMNSKGLAQLAYEKGMSVLTAAQSYQAALEVTKTPQGKKIEHGLLTYSLLEGLVSPKADANADKEVIDRELMNYAVEQVPQMQLEAMQTRDVEVKQGKRDSGLFFVGERDNRIPPGKRGLQTPRVFYRRESSSRPFVVVSY